MARVEGGPGLDGVIEIRSVDLETGFRRVGHAIATAENRPILRTVLLEGDARGLRLVAADNYRLACATVSRQNAIFIGNFILDAADLPMVRAFLRTRDRTIELSLTPKGQLEFRDSHGTVRVDAFVGTFPNYKSVLEDPTGARIEVQFNPAYLAQTAAGLRLPKAAHSLGVGMTVRVPGPDAEPRLPLLITATDYIEAIMPLHSRMPTPMPETKAQRLARKQREYRNRPEVKAARSKRHKAQRAAYRAQLALEGRET